jgi:hypothetical protein
MNSAFIDTKAIKNGSMAVSLLLASMISPYKAKEAGINKANQTSSIVIYKLNDFLIFCIKKARSLESTQN